MYLGIKTNFQVTQKDIEGLKGPVKLKLMNKIILLTISQSTFLYGTEKLKVSPHHQKSVEFEEWVPNRNKTTQDSHLSEAPDCGHILFEEVATASTSFRELRMHSSAVWGGQPEEGTCIPLLPYQGDAVLLCPVHQQVSSSLKTSDVSSQKQCSCFMCFMLHLRVTKVLLIETKVSENWLYMFFYGLSDYYYWKWKNMFSFCCWCSFLSLLSTWSCSLYDEIV